MKVPTRTHVPAETPGSFQMPESLKKKVQEQEALRREKARPFEGDETESVQEGGWSVPSEEELEETIQKNTKVEKVEELDDILKPRGVLKALKEMGVEITEDDVNDYLFYGTIKKSVNIFQMKKGKFFTATIRTLTSKDYMVVEDIIGDYLKFNDMTREGLGSLRTLSVLSLGVVELQGRPTIDSWDSKDDSAAAIKKRALENKKVLEELAPGTINKINHVHAALTTAFNNMLDEGNSPFLINS